MYCPVLCLSLVDMILFDMRYVGRFRNVRHIWLAYNLACWCIQMAYTQHSWMLMDIVVGLSVRPSVRLFVYGIFRWLCICWQITWNKWHKIWHDDVVIIGRWLLPSVVDTGDICCHYWQLILVDIFLTTVVFIPDARPVFSGNVCGTAPSCLKPSATRRGMIIFQCNVIVIMFAVRYGCVMNVLWMCYECVMRVLWERYESVMKVLWKCYESVMGVLWVCYGCVRYVMDVWGMLWMCEVCYGRVRYVMDVLRMYAWWMNDGYFISTV